MSSRTEPPVPQAIQRHGDDDDHADQNLLHVVRDPGQRAAVGQHAHQKRAHERAADAADTPDRLAPPSRRPQ